MSTELDRQVEIDMDAVRKLGEGFTAMGRAFAELAERIRPGIEALNRMIEQVRDEQEAAR